MNELLLLIMIMMTNRGMEDVKSVLPSIRPSALREVAVTSPNVRGQSSLFRRRNGVDHRIGALE